MSLYNYIYYFNFLLYFSSNKRFLSRFRLVVPSQVASIFYHVRNAGFPATWTARRTWEPARGRAVPLNSASPVRRSRIRARARRHYWPPRRNATINVSLSVRGRASGICGDCKTTSSDRVRRREKLVQFQSRLGSIGKEMRD